jgi:phospholipid/cholesterol/gamma-HCH transport system substrate-binding protein
MSQSRIEIKVGIFVLVGLLLLAGLSILFTKGTAFYRNTYELRLLSGNVGGIKPGAAVQMRGVQIGNVSSAKLNPDGRGVTMILKIESKYGIDSDARFEIEQSGFLGDQFIAIYPGQDAGRKLGHLDEVQARNPFNMQEAVAVATETLSKISEVTTNLNAAVHDVRRLVLTEPALQRFNTTLNRFGDIAAEAHDAMSRLNVFLASNAPSATATLSNLNSFSGQLPPLATRVHSLVESNAVEISSAIRNLETASASLTNLMHELQHGHGPAARILRDEQLAANLSAIASNLSITTSNLNRVGLWGILWKQKPPPAPKTSPSAGHR